MARKFSNRNSSGQFVSYLTWQAELDDTELLNAIDRAGAKTRAAAKGITSDINIIERDTKRWVNTSATGLRTVGNEYDAVTLRALKLNRGIAALGVAASFFDNKMARATQQVANFGYLAATIPGVLTPIGIGLTAIAAAGVFAWNRQPIADWIEGVGEADATLKRLQDKLKAGQDARRTSDVNPALGLASPTTANLALVRARLSGQPDIIASAEAADQTDQSRRRQAALRGQLGTIDKGISALRVLPGENGKQIDALQSRRREIERAIRTESESQVLIEQELQQKLATIRDEAVQKDRDREAVRFKAFEDTVNKMRSAAERAGLGGADFHRGAFFESLSGPISSAIAKKNFEQIIQTLPPELRGTASSLLGFDKDKGRSSLGDVAEFGGIRGLRAATASGQLSGTQKKDPQLDELIKVAKLIADEMRRAQGLSN